MKKTYTGPQIEKKGDIRSATQGGPGAGVADTFLNFEPFEHAPAS